MISRTPSATRTDTLFTYTTLFRSNHAARIGETLDEDAARLVGDRGRDIGGIVGIDEARMPIHLAEAVADLVERPTIEPRRGDDMAARLHQRVEGEEQIGRAHV